jgi:acyl-CoA dehydrogenase
VPRLNSRVAFGRRISEQGVWRERIADAAHPHRHRPPADAEDGLHDGHRRQQAFAKAEIAMIKVLAPNVAQQVLDWAIQAHGAAGVSDDFPLAYQWARQPHPAPGRRSGRGASQCDRQAGTGAVPTI